MFKTQKNLNHHLTRPTKATSSSREFIKFTEDCVIFWSFSSEQRIQRRDKKTLWDPSLKPMSSMQQTKGQEISPHLFSSTRRQPHHSTPIPLHSTSFKPLHHLSPLKVTRSPSTTKESLDREFTKTKKKNKKNFGTLDRFTLLVCVFGFVGTNVLTFIFEFNFVFRFHHE